MYYNKLSLYESISLIVIIIINHLLLDFPSSFIDNCGSGSLLNTLYIIFLGYILLTIILKLFEPFSNLDIFDISEFLGGKILKIIIAFIFLFYIIFIAGTLLRSFSEALNLTYFERIPLYLILLFFIVSPVLSNNYSSKAILKTNGFIFPIVIISFIIITISIGLTIKYEKIFPLYGYGIKSTFLLNSSNIFIFSGLGYLYFLPPWLQKKEDFKKIGYYSFFITSIILLLCVLALTFSLINFNFLNELSPIYLLVRASNYGIFLQRPESIFILIWILSLMSYLSISIMMISYVFKKITNIKKEKNLSSLFGNIIFLIALIPSNIWQIKYLESNLYKNLALLIIFFLGILILTLSNIKLKIKKRRCNK